MEICACVYEPMRSAFSDKHRRWRVRIQQFLVSHIRMNVCVGGTRCVYECDHHFGIYFPFNSDELSAESSTHSVHRATDVQLVEWRADNKNVVVDDWRLTVSVIFEWTNAMEIIFGAYSVNRKCFYFQFPNWILSIWFKVHSICVCVCVDAVGIGIWCIDRNE